MKMIFRLVCVCSTLLSLLPFASASSIQPLSPSAAIEASAAVFRGTVLRFSCFKDTNGLIFTRTTIQVTEPLKGTFARTIQLVHRGGQIGGDDDFCGLSPRLAPGEEYLFFVHRRADGQLECTQGSASAVKLVRAEGSTSYASPGGDLLITVRQLTNNGKTPGEDVTDQAAGHVTEAATGMLGGVASRYLQPDRGEPIPYLIDATSLPAGMTLTQATNAVQQALNAWTAVTSLKFQLEAIQSFGQGADAITASDGKLRIQLHDAYNRINTANTLGIGGRNAVSSPVAGLGWNLGGNIAGNEFLQTTRGYVVLEAGNSSMQNVATFAEVLCHEIGHALCLAHSSESTNEPNSTLKQAIMYFQAHADGRGATLGSYDISTIQQVYPFNTAPFTYNRVIDCVTQPSGAPNVPGINEVQMRGCDLQTANPTMDASGVSPGGVTGDFSVNANNLIKFTPNDYWVDPRVDPSTTAYYERGYVRFTDGTNASPYATVRVISHLGDTAPFPTGDGIPDDWMSTYFGSISPSAGNKSRAIDDADGDKLTNLDEFRTGMAPNDSSSAQRITLVNKTNIQWQAKAYELYEVFGSTNLTTWTPVGYPVLPTTSTGSLSISPSNSYRFFRILKVP